MARISWLSGDPSKPDAGDPTDFFPGYAGSGIADRRAVYRPRHLEKTAFYRLFQDHFDNHIRAHKQRFEPRSELLRPVVVRSVEELLSCGCLEGGFARPRRPFRTTPPAAGPSNWSRARKPMGSRSIWWTMLKTQICLRRGHIRSRSPILPKSWASSMSQDQGETCNQRNGGIFQGARARGLVCFQDIRLPMLSQRTRQAITVHLRATPPFLVIPRPARKRSGTSMRPCDRDRKTPISTR